MLKVMLKVRDCAALPAVRARGNKTIGQRPLLIVNLARNDTGHTRVVKT